MRCRPLLGTFVEITAPDAASAAVDNAFAVIEQVQRRMSFHDEESDVARLRQTAPGEVVKVARETIEVLEFALDLNRLTDGLFDVTVGRELVRGGFLPVPRGSRLRRYSGTSRDIEIIDECHIRCSRPVLVDLGGIAKGYAVDRAVGVLQAAGARKGLVNAGGDLRMFGDASWPVTLRDADGGLRREVVLADCAVASSANLGHRRRRWGRLRTPHIGFGRRSIVSQGRMTVIAPCCVIADAMTKVAMADRPLAERLLACHGGYVIDESQDRMAA